MNRSLFPYFLVYILNVFGVIKRNGNTRIANFTLVLCQLNK